MEGNNNDSIPTMDVESCILRLFEDSNLEDWCDISNLSSVIQLPHDSSLVNTWEGKEKMERQTVNESERESIVLLNKSDFSMNTRYQGAIQRELITISQEYKKSYPQNYVKGKPSIIILANGNKMLSACNIIEQHETLKLSANKKPRQEVSLKGIIVPTDLKMCAVYQNKIFICETRIQDMKLQIRCYYKDQNPGSVRWYDFLTEFEQAGRMITLRTDKKKNSKSNLLVFSTHFQFLLQSYYRSHIKHQTTEDCFTDERVMQKMKALLKKNAGVTSCPCPHCLSSKHDQKKAPFSQKIVS